MIDNKSIAERLADAVTMFTVSAICLTLLLFVAHGTVSRTYEQLVIDKLVAQGELVQSPMESFVRPGLPMRQFGGFQQIAEPMVKQDDMLDTMLASDRLGEIIFISGDASVRALPPTKERQLANDVATMRSDKRLLQVVLPLRDKFERVGDLVLSVDRNRAMGKVDAHFRLPYLVSIIVSLGFALIVFMGWKVPEARRRRHAAAAFVTAYLSVAAAIALTMVTVFSEGAQSKGQVLADSLSQRFDDIVNFGLQLDQVDGLDEVLSEYRRLNPEIAAAGVTVNSRIVVHTDPSQVGRYWTSESSNHEYRADLTPPNHPRSSTVILAVPKAIVYWQVLRSVKNFAALFVASSLIAFLFMQVAQAIQHAMRDSRAGRSGWRDLAALDLVKPVFFMAVFVDNLAYAFLPQFVSQLVAQQGLPPNYVAIPFMAYYLCFALALMPAGRYELRAGSRPLILLGLALTALSFILLSVVDNFYFVLMSRALTGAGQGMLFIGIQSFVLAKAAREHRTQANTIIVFGFQAGMISGMAIGSLLVGQISPNGVFALGALVAALAVIYTMLLMPNSVGSTGSRIAQPSAGEVWREMGWMLRDSKFLRTILLIGIPAKAVMTGVILFAMPLLLHSRGFAQEDIGQITMIYAACVIVSSAWAAKLADQSSETGNILSWGAILTAGGMVTIAACGWAPALSDLHASTIATMLTIAGVAMVGVAHGFINAPVVTHVTQTAVAERTGSSQVGAAYRLLERAGHTVGPILMGQLFLHLGISYAAFAWAGFVILVLGFLFLISTRNEPSASRPREEYA